MWALIRGPGHRRGRSSGCLGRTSKNISAMSTISTKIRSGNRGPMRGYFLIALAAGAFVAAMVAPSAAQDPLPDLNSGRLSAAPKGKGKGKTRPPARPTPHWPDGHVNLGPLPGEKGVWEGNAGATLALNPPGGLDNAQMYLPTNLKIADVRFQPWARAIYEYRQATTTKDDPHVRCKPSGGPRMFHTPYGMEFIEVPDQKRIYILGVGGPHTWRVIYMDGREHPKDMTPSFA